MTGDGSSKTVTGESGAGDRNGFEVVGSGEPIEPLSMLLGEKSIDNEGGGVNVGEVGGRWLFVSKRNAGGGLGESRIVMSSPSGTKAAVLISMSVSVGD